MRRLGRSLRFALLLAGAALVLGAAAAIGLWAATHFADPLQAGLVAALGALALALAVAWALGRRWVEPLETLRDAAWRFGRGDLSTPIPPLPGRELGALAATLDDARRRLQEQSVALRGRDEEASSLLLGMADGVIAVDGERRLTYLNPQAARLLRVDAAAVLGRFCGDVLQPRPSAAGRRPCRDACPIVHARSLGQARAIEALQAADRPALVLRASRPAGGRQVVLLRDETEQEAARRARDAVLANVSHELKTPVAGQLASLELLLDLELEPPSARELARSLQRSTLRLLRLIDNLLESVRLELAPGRAADDPVDLDAMLDEAIDFVAPLLGQRDQQLVEAWRRPLPPARGEQAALTRVFVNLLANAHHAAPAGSTIALGAERGEGMLRLWVEDQGPGVDPEVRESLFERFQRAPSAGGRGGLGLGLWIARNIVSRHGGKLVAEPGGEGRGARFTVELPVAPEGDAP